MRLIDADKLTEFNCHGCKWLDEVKSQPKGCGYCSMVKTDKARYTDMPRCEMYEVGNFGARMEQARSRIGARLDGEK